MLSRPRGREVLAIIGVGLQSRHATGATLRLRREVHALEEGVSRCKRLYTTIEDRVPVAQASEIHMLYEPTSREGNVRDIKPLTNTLLTWSVP